MPETPPQPDTARKMVPEIPFDPTNHHNALGCPYHLTIPLILRPAPFLTSTCHDYQARGDCRVCGHEQNKPLNAGEVRYDNAAFKNTDDGSADLVLAAVRHCANSWDGNARLLGNVRASDISRACDIALAALSPPPAKQQIRREALETAAKAIFDGRPHNHPDGQIPNWDHQPEHIKSGFRRDAAAALAATEKER